jgi:hypothetical protein
MTRPHTPAGDPDLVPPAQRLNQMLLGQFVARSLALVSELGVADLLRDGPRSLHELAQQTGSDADALYRVLRALAALEVFTESPGPSFANSELSHFLRKDVDGSLGAMARWLGDISGWTAWGRLDHSVRTGAPAFDAVLGCDCFSWLQRHPDTLRVFQDAMTSYSGVTGRAVSESYDFSSIGTLLDVGGGHGMLLSLILARFPQLSGILYDRPEVIEPARAHWAEAPQGARIRFMAGNFLESVPAGADAIIMKNILHDWDDAHAAQLLAHCRGSSKPGGRLLVVECVLDDSPASTFAKFLDLEMLVVTPGGRERTAAEFRELLARAGFELTRIVPTPSPVCVIEAFAR